MIFDLLHFLLYVVCVSLPKKTYMFVEMSGALTKVLPRQCRGNTQGLFIYAKRAVNEKIAGCGENSSVFTNEQSPQSGAFSGDLLDQKLFAGPWGGGGRGGVTND